MQESPQIGWDPGYESRPPWESKLLVLYVVFVVVVSFVRLVRVTRQLWWFSKGRCTSVNESDKADQLAASALANGASTSEFASVDMQVLERADNTFLYIWEICAASVASTKKFVPLTLLFAMFVLLVSTTRILVQISTLKFTGNIAFVFITGAVAPPLMQFAIATFLAAVLYCVSSFYEGVLTRRRASWNYSYAKAKTQVLEDMRSP